jgi:hypothetical protein
VRTSLGEAAFNDWGWRIPFLFSFLLMFIAYYIRANFQGSPIFEEIKAKAEMLLNAVNSTEPMGTKMVTNSGARAGNS